MDAEQLAIKMQEVADRTLRNEARIKKLEGEQETTRSLATSVAVMAEQLKTMNTNVCELTTKVDKLERKPAKRWESIGEKALWMLIAAVITYLLSHFGL